MTPSRAPATPPPPPLSPSKPNLPNFLALSNDHDSIRGEFVIDPSIVIPSTLLPPLADRKNLSLTSENSSIKAQIWLLGQRAAAKAPQRTTIALASTHGSIHATLHTLDATPFSLTAAAHHEGVKLAVPTSFQGLLSLTTRHGRVSLSDGLIQNGTQLSQVGNTQRYFIGDFQLLSEEEWQGDQMEISVGAWVDSAQKVTVTGGAKAWGQAHYIQFRFASAILSPSDIVCARRKTEFVPPINGKVTPHDVYGIARERNSIVTKRKKILGYVECL
ncbi:hypothetical protein JVU11DRAFT_7764 [Chiua virens]|nr:hypothetical protein JVU11DRAFT_7764 [Chiua virens]